MTVGEGRKIDKEAGKITITHGEIKNIAMPPMTRVFRVKEPSMLDPLKPGDKILFPANKVGGQYTVTSLEPAQSMLDILGAHICAGTWSNGIRGNVP